MEKRHASGWQPLVLAVVGLVVIMPLYALSSGPVALLICRTKTGNDIWNVIYWPLLRAAESAGLLIDLLWYCHWWVNLPNGG
jgi:hypothetical protein